MAEELKHGPEDTGFEHQDLSPRSVYGFLVGLAVGVVLVAVVLLGIYHAMDAYEREHQPSQSPLLPQTQADTRHVTPEMINAFPQPRLEKNERLEINAFLLREEQTLDSYGWIDQKAGVVRIPIDRAMQLIAQRGLPTAPRAGTAPPAQGSAINQAAQSSSASSPSMKGKKQR
jgi:hypothetical protein